MFHHLSLLLHQLSHLFHKLSHRFSVTLAENRPVQITVLIFAICVAIWSVFFVQSFKASVAYSVVSICLRQSIVNPLTALDESGNPRYIRFRKLCFRWSIFIIFLPDILILILPGNGVVFQYGSSGLLVCTMFLMEGQLALLLFYRPQSSDNLAF